MHCHSIDSFKTHSGYHVHGFQILDLGDSQDFIAKYPKYAKSYKFMQNCICLKPDRTSTARYGLLPGNAYQAIAEITRYIYPRPTAL